LFELPARTTMPDVVIASRSEVGARSRNEDYLQHGAFDAGWYAVLSDGAGGHSNGAVAADMVVRMVAHELGSQLTKQGRAQPALIEVVHTANDALNRQQQGLRGQKRMHATLVMLWIGKDTREAVWSHVGDSRLYLLRQGRVAQVTRDDSVVQTMVDAGLIAPHEARSHSQRNQLIAAMGSDEPIEPHVSDPGFLVQDGDAFLLCSDGWYDRLDEADIEQSLAEADSVEAWLDAMQALVHARQRANQDNFSAVAVWVGNPAEVTRIGPL
jgi:PPM family protein phosphatase